MNWNYWVHYVLNGKKAAEDSLKPYETDLHIEAQKLEHARMTLNPYAVETTAYRAKDGTLHDTREAALDKSRRAEYRKAYEKATRDLDTIAHLGGPFDRYECQYGRNAKDLVIHKILTHKDMVRRILDSIPTEPKT